MNLLICHHFIACHIILTGFTRLEEVALILSFLLFSTVQLIFARENQLEMHRT